MRVVTLPQPDDFDGWRDDARGLAADGVPPEDIVWQVGTTPTDLFAGEAVAHAAPPPNAGFSVPRPFMDLARRAALASDPERWALLYTALTRAKRLAVIVGDPRAIARAARTAEIARTHCRLAQRLRAAFAG